MGRTHDFIARLHPIDEEIAKQRKRKKTWDEMSSEERYAFMAKIELADSGYTEFLKSFDKHWSPVFSSVRSHVVDVLGFQIVYRDGAYSYSGWSYPLSSLQHAIELITLPF